MLDNKVVCSSSRKTVSLVLCVGLRPPALSSVHRSISIVAVLDQLTNSTLSVLYSTVFCRVYVPLLPLALLSLTPEQNPILRYFLAFSNFSLKDYIPINSPTSAFSSYSCHPDEWFTWSKSQDHHSHQPAESHQVTKNHLWRGGGREHHSFRLLPIKHKQI